MGDPILETNLTRRVDFALFMVDALTNEALVHKAPAIVGCNAASVREHKQMCDADSPSGPPRTEPS